MRSHGDIPEFDLELVNQLIVMENLIYKHEDEISVLEVAKGLVCIAHDYLAVEMEEEAERLIKKVESKCPGYFKGPILSAANLDSDFAYLLCQLENTLVIDLMVSFGYECE